MAGGKAGQHRVRNRQAPIFGWSYLSGLKKTHTLNIFCSTWRMLRTINMFTNRYMDIYLTTSRPTLLGPVWSSLREVAADSSTNTFSRLDWRKCRDAARGYASVPTGGGACSQTIRWDELPKPTTAMECLRAQCQGGKQDNGFRDTFSMREAVMATEA
jgi:hypothetical protein